MHQLLPISLEKIAAYENTDYRVYAKNEEFVIRIGEISERLKSEFKHRNIYSAGFFTAYNPMGILQSDEKNREAHINLGIHLSGLNFEFYEGWGCDQKDQWPAEQSFFVYSIGLSESKKIGREFNQDAIVWIDKTAIPQLIILREVAN